MFNSDQVFTPPENPYNFRAWMELISKIDSVDPSSLPHQQTQLCLSNFNTFLETFPWLHKYWSKYAAFTYSVNFNILSAKQIFMKALSKSKLIFSVDMWIEYIKFLQTHLSASEQDSLGKVFAEALDAVGSLYNSSEIWHLALNYEHEHRRTRFFLLSKVITYPVADLKQFWAELQTIISRVPIGQLRQFDPRKPVSELLTMQEQPANLVLPPTTEKQMREEITSQLSNYYNESLKILSKRYKYEINISRQYFDFNSPDEIQIGNWEAYTAMLEQEYREKPTIENYIAATQCYERALIPCAFVDSIWLNYANFMEDVARNSSTQKTFASIDDVRDIYERIPYDVLPSARIVYAEFEEVYYATKASSTYDQMASSKYAEQVVAAAYYAKRTSGDDQAAEILRSAAQRFIQADDQEGGSVVAATLLELANESTNDVFGAIYLSEYAKKLIYSDPEQSNKILYDFIYNNQKNVTLEDKILMLDIYLEYARNHSISAGFQLDLEILRNKFRNKLVFNKDYFNNTYMLSGRPPEQRMKEWITSSSSTS